MGAALVAMLAAPPAGAVQWVKYTFTGTGSAAQTTSGASPATSAQRVSFTGTVTVDLDAHASIPASGPWWLSDGGTSYLAPAIGTASSADSAYAKAAGVALGTQAAGGIQNWNVRDLTTAGYAGRFPVFAGSQAATGSVDFTLGNKMSGWSGNGQITAITAERVASPVAWALTVNPAAAVGAAQQSPVPEPATWGMMILGLAAVGMAARYRYRSRRPTAA